MIPLLRAAGLAPILAWMQRHGRDPMPMLDAVDLGWCDWSNPYAAVPLLPAARFLRDLARIEGPDLPRRAFEDNVFPELGLLRDAGLRAGTPGRAFEVIVAAMPKHCSHEMFSAVRDDAGNLVIRDGWLTAFDDETMHVVQQYVAAIVERICDATGSITASLRSVRMVPHPEMGLDHLKPWLGERVTMATEKHLEIVVAREVADRPFRVDALPDAAAPLVSKAPLPPLCTGRRTSDSVEVVLGGMIGHGKPTLTRIARLSGMSPRSLQRALDAEGEPFSALLDRVRERKALDLIAGGMAIAEISAMLGYERQSAFTRAFRRWRGETPSAARKGT